MNTFLKVTCIKLPAQYLVPDPLSSEHAALGTTRGRQPVFGKQTPWRRQRRKKGRLYRE